MNIKKDNTGEKQMKKWEYGLLQVSQNKKYLQNGSEPFFWLADTAWLLFQKCSLEECKCYLKNRRDKGFTVIQAVLIHSLPDAETKSSLAAAQADPRISEYWEHCDKVIRMAEDLGLYMALLPAWGAVVKGGILNEENVETYMRFLGERYAEHPNIIWILGGDIRGSAALDLYRKAGKTLKEVNPNKLIGFHPFGRTSSSMWFHSETWLDFNMFQSGHRRYDQVSLGAWDDNRVKEDFFGEDNWKYVKRDHELGEIKPTVDGEPSYEWILQGLHVMGEPYWREWDVRRYAYWSVFQGAMGHTYGDNAIQQFYNNISERGAYGVKQIWQDSIHHVGSEQMGIMKELMESVDYQSGCPAEELLLDGQREGYERIAVFAGDDYLFAYDYTGRSFVIDLSRFLGKKIDAWWMNPISGRYSYFAEFTGKKQAKVKPVNRFTEDNDWVLVLRAEFPQF